MNGIENNFYHEDINEKDFHRKDKVDYLKEKNKVNKIKEKSEKKHYQDKIEAELERKLQLEGPKNIIDIIENKEEFMYMMDVMGELIAFNIDWTEFNKKPDEKQSNGLKKILKKEMENNPEKFKQMHVILGGINRNGLKNFFDKKEINFVDKIKKLGKEVSERYKNIEHIPDSEKSFLDNIKKYYN